MSTLAPFKPACYLILLSVAYPVGFPDTSLLGTSVSLNTVSDATFSSARNREAGPPRQSGRKDPAAIIFRLIPRKADSESPFSSIISFSHIRTVLPETSQIIDGSAPELSITLVLSAIRTSFARFFRDLVSGNAFYRLAAGRSLGVELGLCGL